jgi:AcrR family transcriptional regulator
LSPRSPQENQKLRDQKKEIILKAALKVIAKNSLSSTRIDDIAKEAGISHGAVYQYFKSKEEIYSVLVENAFNFAGILSENELPKGKTPLEDIRLFIHGFFNELSRQDDFSYYFMISIQTIFSDNIPENVRERAVGVPPALKYLTQKVFEGQSAGEIVDGDARSLAYTVFSCLTGIAIAYKRTLFIPDPEYVLRILKK